MLSFQTANNQQSVQIKSEFLHVILFQKQSRKTVTAHCVMLPLTVLLRSPLVRVG